MELGAHRHNLSLEEVPNVAPKLGPPFCKVQRLRQVEGNLELKGDTLLSDGTNIAWEAVNKLCFLTGSALHYMIVSLTLISLIDLFA